MHPTWFASRPRQASREITTIPDERASSRQLNDDDDDDGELQQGVKTRHVNAAVENFADSDRASPRLGTLNGAHPRAVIPDIRHFATRNPRQRNG